MDEKPGSRWAIDEPSSASSRGKIWAFRAVACAIPVLVGVVATIWILMGQERLVVDTKTRRVTIQQPPIYLQEIGHETTGHKYLFDQVLGWQNIPNWQATTYGRPLTINSKGLRDREYAYDKPPGVRRILVLGDSYVWGYGVGDDELFTEILEKQLGRSNPAWQVLNTGVSGWGNDQEYLYLINEGLKYSPDIVILSFFLFNDPSNNVASAQYGLRKPVFLNTDLKLGNVPVPPPGSGLKPIRSTVPEMDLTMAIISAMHERCEAKGSQFVVIKSGTFLKPEIVDQEREFEVALNQRLPDTPYLDLDEAFTERQLTLDDLTLGNEDGHWNAATHTLVAELLLGFMQERELVGGESSEQFPDESGSR